MNTRICLATPNHLIDTNEGYVMTVNKKKNKRGNIATLYVPLYQKSKKSSPNVLVNKNQLKKYEKRCTEKDKILF